MKRKIKTTRIMNAVEIGVDKKQKQALERRMNKSAFRAFGREIENERRKNADCEK